ncbi:hypothetical protein PRIPAC_76011 [Pristionchus pacificus]|uniref:Uncharacterized protein n=1 Tax=Pristionchus pacificus TaxID=54126 RepID=A0A2A6C8K6_PRIPA|nr:hypothetical protein PRIPAC_76011 [Pristionchus pacificus]|eukprot:PDM74447.1 hypothetical protein PRIPAC_41803 [Pristionchus pacificus]
MHGTVLLLLLVPVAIAMRCYVGGGATGSNVYPEVYQQQECADRNEQYCYKRYFTNAGQNTVIKNCGNGFCPREGCNDATGVCCCKGDYCNSVAGSSFITASLAAVAAALLRV